MSKELRQAGMLPHDVMVPSLQELRRYQDSFDTILSNVASRQQHRVFDQSAYRAITADLNTLSSSALDNAASSLFERGQSRALIAQPFGYNIPHGSPLSHLMLSSSAERGFKSSQYAQKFHEICLLGEGGFGHVYRAQHVLDGQQYAVKKIRITATQLRAITSEADAKPLLAELRALANLQQRNVVRYFDSWIETSPATNSSQQLISDRAFDTQTSNSDISEQSEDSLRAPLQELDDEDVVVFESSTTQDRPVMSKSQTTSMSKSVRPSIFRKPSEISSDESTEELPRLDERGGSNLVARSDRDMTIFIQMALHPMTLEDYLWPDQQANQTNSIRHCFHAFTTSRIILAILDGIEYIHSKRIIHRDLKPSNIFLSVDRGIVPPEGAINVTACSQCPPTISHENIYLIPHIGDFGLIAKLEDSRFASSPGTTSPKPSPIEALSSVAGTRQPGTRFYCAPDASPRVVCEKLDVYSLGVIMFELSCDFSTKSERHDTLTELNVDKLRGHVLKPVIEGMLEKQREKRWSCGQVRRFLKNIM